MRRVAGQEHVAAHSSSGRRRTQSINSWSAGLELSDDFGVRCLLDICYSDFAPSSPDEPFDIVLVACENRSLRQFPNGLSCSARARRSFLSAATRTAVRAAFISAWVKRPCCVSHNSTAARPARRLSASRAAIVIQAETLTLSGGRRQNVFRECRGPQSWQV